MSNFETNYQPLASYMENGEETPQEGGDVMIHVVPESSKARWNHIDNLDSFFTRVYHYHQNHGIWCLLISEFLDVVKFVFVYGTIIFMIYCVVYEVLFGNKYMCTLPVVNDTVCKVTFGDVIRSPRQCVACMNGWVIALQVVLALYTIFRLIKVAYNYFQYQEIQNFYTTALKIDSSELENMTWYEIQQRMQEVQSEQQMCIHKSELTELDIYHRILRFHNYKVAMVNKNLLPIKFDIPFLGETVYFTKGMLFNFDLILFNGPWALFENNWQLKEEYKKIGKRKELADQLSKHILWIGIANLILCPISFLYQMIYVIFSKADMIKREPGMLSMRRWSMYSKYYCSHFNELPHELLARQNRAYGPSKSYIDLFSSHLMVIFTKNLAFFFGSLFIIWVSLSVWDDDVLNVNHMLTFIAGLGLMATLCRSCIPDEHQVYCPELLLTTVLSHIHYMPDHWKGKAHTQQVRKEFSQLFQYKAVYLLEELLSALITPHILIFWLRHRSLDIVDFYRNFTVNVVGVGDVCSFALMDLRKHGNPMWTLNEQQTASSNMTQAEDGKTELSLLHFTMTNPEFKLPQPASAFMAQMRDNAARDLEHMETLREENPLYYSLRSVTSMGPGYSLLGGHPRPMFSGSSGSSCIQPHLGGASRVSPVIRGAGISRMDSPGHSSSSGLLSSVQQAVSQSGSMVESMIQAGSIGSTHGLHHDAMSMEMMTADMSFSTLYLHELHHRRWYNRVGADSNRAPSLWHKPVEQVSMPCIHEAPQENEDGGGENMPLLDDHKLHRLS